ncbi:MAG: hypothetical protein FVQ78_06960 [Solirubrobacterales bacterium]|nr:hypothetical protein [Solirubrobacterales bacterium]
MESSARKSSLPKLALALAVALLVAVPVALAAGERDEYVARVEPICKANTKANARILKGVKGQVQKGRLVLAGKRFIRASRAFGKAVRQIAKVPRPAPDAAKLKRWIGYLRLEKSLLQKVGKALKANNKFKAQQLSVRLNRNSNRANNTVINFSFDECRIDSSRFL